MTSEHGNKSNPIAGWVIEGSRPAIARKRSLLVLSLILIVALFLRLVAVSSSSSQVSDFEINRMAAEEFASEGSLSSLPPHYYIGPAVVGGIAIWLTGNANAYYVFQALLGTASIFLMCLLATRMFGSTRVGLLAATLLAVYPDHVLYTAIFGYEIASCLFITLLLLAFPSPYPSSRPYLRGFFVAFIVIVSLLFRSYLLPVVPIVVAVYFVTWIMRKLRRYSPLKKLVLDGKFVLGLSVSFVLLYSGYSFVRSRVIDATLQPIGVFLWWGNNPVTGGEFPPPKERSALDPITETYMQDVYRTDEYLEAVGIFAFSDPYRAFTLQIEKLLKLVRLKPDSFPIRQWIGGSNSAQLLLASSLLILFFVLLCITGVAGHLSRSISSRCAFGYWLIIVVLVLVNLVGVVCPRYRQPLVIFGLIPFSASIMIDLKSQVVEIWRSQKRRRILIALLSLLGISWLLDIVYMAYRHFYTGLGWC